MELAATVAEVSGHCVDYILWEMSLTEAFYLQREWITTLKIKHRIKIPLQESAPLRISEIII